MATLLWSRNPTQDTEDPPAPPPMEQCAVGLFRRSVLNMADLLSPQEAEDVPAPLPSQQLVISLSSPPPSPADQAAVRPQSLTIPIKTMKSRATKTNPEIRVVQDKQRKRRTYLSTKQKQLRRDHEAYESRVFNLTLDVNALKQEVMRLMEYRDLQVTQLLLNRHRLENKLMTDVEVMVHNMRENRKEPLRCRFLCTRDAEEGQYPSAPLSVIRGGIFEFTIRLDEMRTLCKITHMRVLTFDEEDAEQDNASAADVRQVCGFSGGYVVEVTGVFTNTLLRNVVLLVYPHAAGDEMLMSELVGLRLTYQGPLRLYFNAQRELVWQVGQADLSPALYTARPKEVSTLITRSHDSD